MNSACFVSLAAIVLASCGGGEEADSGPENSVRAFVAAYERSDAAGMCESLGTKGTTDVRRYVADKLAIEALRGQVDPATVPCSRAVDAALAKLSSSGSAPRIGELKVVDVDQSEQRATVKTADRDYVLEEENGAWKLVAFPFGG